MDMGCVRMTERYFSADPPTAEQVAAATADIDALVDEAARSVDLTGIGTLVGLPAA